MWPRPSASLLLRIGCLSPVVLKHPEICWGVLYQLHRDFLAVDPVSTKQEEPLPKRVAFLPLL